jgi:molybdenum cofactor synthesis domain-containing protein
MEPFGVAGLVIGNEVLTAKVTEANGAWMIKRLRERGVPLRAVHVVADEVDEIVETLMMARRRARWVVTSGGIGPTHDDVTIRAVALALGRKVVRMPEIETAVRAHYGERLTPQALRLAEAPEGSELVSHPSARYPVVACEGVFMLPGVPELFKLQLESVMPRFEAAPVVLGVLYLCLPEPPIAGVLDSIALAHPEVAIGSYPTFDPDAGYRTKITVEHGHQKCVDEVMGKLEKQLPANAIIRRG